VRAAERRRVQPFLIDRLESGDQVYFVSPRIGEAAADVEEVIETDSGSAEAAMARLSRTPMARFGIELVHGRVPPVERARRLERFRKGEAKVLVATTVIEVGVDVPAATVMIVENAERLGLAQLHQLRGRVGRGSKESWCLLFGKDSARERLTLLERTCDGFEIAEEDLRRRGMGDLAGRRQAGESLEGFVDPEGDLDLLFAARDLVAARPDLAASYASEGDAVGTP
jgi:ATP-dependent DNA helicase RecG